MEYHETTGHAGDEGRSWAYQPDQDGVVIYDLSAGVCCHSHAVALIDGSNVVAYTALAAYGYAIDPLNVAEHVGIDVFRRQRIAFVVHNALSQIERVL